jgi:hypothetical protein
MDNTHPLVVAALKDFQETPGKADSVLDHYLTNPTRLTEISAKIKGGDIAGAKELIAAKGEKCFLMENEEALFTAFLIHFTPAPVG